MTERIPWITCYLTDILISYVRDHISANGAKIDYPALFRDARVIETPANPEAFLTDVNNWVPLSVLRALEIQCERRRRVAQWAGITWQFSPSCS